MKRALIATVIAVLLIVAGAGVAYYLHVRQQARDVKGSSTIEFVTTEAAPPAPPASPGSSPDPVRGAGNSTRGDAARCKREE